MLIGGMPFSLSLPISQCVVPEGINGPVAIWITSDDQPLNAGAVDRQSNAIVAGPLMTFIDSKPDGLGSLVRKNDKSGSGNNEASPSTTTTVSPAEASGLLASLSEMASATASGESSSTTSSAEASATSSAEASATSSAEASETSSAEASASATASQVNGVVFSMVPMPTKAPE